MKKFNGSETAKKRSILKKDSLYKEETEKLISDNHHKGTTEGSDAMGSAFVPISKFSIHDPYPSSSVRLHKPIGPKPKTHAQPIKFVGLDDDTDSLGSGRGSPALSVSHAPDIPWRPHPPLSPSHSRTLQFPSESHDSPIPLDRRFQDGEFFDADSTTGSPAHHHRIHRMPSYCANTSTYGPSHHHHAGVNPSPPPLKTEVKLQKSEPPLAKPPQKSEPPQSKKSSELANSVVGLPLLLATVPIVSPIQTSTHPPNPALQPDASVRRPPLEPQPSQQSTTDDDSVFGRDYQNMMSRQASKESAALS